MNEKKIWQFKVDVFHFKVVYSPVYDPRDTHKRTCRLAYDRAKKVDDYVSEQMLTEKIGHLEDWEE